MKLPVIVRVAPLIYTVKVVGGLVNGEGERLLAQASAGNLEICIDSDQPATGMWPSLLHEILHLVLEQAGHMKAAADEGLIRALTYGLMNVSLDGRALLRGVRDGEDGQGGVPGGAAGDRGGDGPAVRRPGQGDRRVGHLVGEC